MAGAQRVKRVQKESAAANPHYTHTQHRAQAQPLSMLTTYTTLMKAIRVTEDTHVTIMDNINSVHTTAGKVVESAVNIVYKSNNVNVNSDEHVTRSNNINGVDYVSLLNEEAGKLEEANAKIKALEKELGDKFKACGMLESDYNAECAKNDTLEHMLKPVEGE